MMLQKFTNNDICVLLEVSNILTLMHDYEKDPKVIDKLKVTRQGLIRIRQKIRHRITEPQFQFE